MNAIMTERYPNKVPINDAIKRIENPLHDEMMSIYNLGLEDGKSDVLNKIISESTFLKVSYTDHDKDTYRRGINNVLKIIDKYNKVESEG